MRPYVRPDPFHWVLYAFGAGLPERNREWVLHDATTGTWLLRHMIRSVVQIVPIAVVLYFVIPGPPQVRIAAVLMGAAIGLAYAGVFSWAAVGHRVVKAGYPESLAEERRRERVKRREQRHPSNV